MDMLMLVAFGAVLFGVAAFAIIVFMEVGLEIAACREETRQHRNRRMMRGLDLP